MPSYHEHFSRSVIKAITFRCLILVSDFAIIFFITHRYDTTIALVCVSNLASTVLYVFHERIWNHVHWGKKLKKTEQPSRKRVK